MKKFFFITLCVLAVACTKTPEQKAEVLIKNEILKSLVLPDTYQAVETRLDSAFTPSHDPEVINTVLDICKKGMEMDKLDKEMKRAKSSMAIWSGSYMSAYEKEQYRQAKEGYNAAKSKYETLMGKAQKSAEALKGMLVKDQEFEGFYAHHRYRANNNAGNTILSGKYFLFDKDISKIIAQWEEEEIDAYNEFMEQVAEAALEAESSN